MQLRAIQSPYAYTLAAADAAVDFVIDELGRCDDSLDLILLPEYANAPSAYPPGECIPYAVKHTDRLIDAAVAAAKRCRALVAVNFAADIDGRFRNTTRVFDAAGRIAGDYYKQHLPRMETAVKKMDDSYTWTYQPPTLLDIDGIRLGFLTCYDCYFDEYIAHIAAGKPDIILVSSHQRAEARDVLEILSRSTALRCNAFVLRASVSMGEGADGGGGSMVVAPDGRILASFTQETGALTHDIGDPHYKYTRSNGFSGAPIRHDDFIEQGRTPWCYRACGGAVKPNDAQLPYPRVCAHRGFNTIAPENSLPAFAAAIALGATEIELDVWETRDGELVVCHDMTVDRIADGRGQIPAMTFAELRRLDFGARHGPAFAGLKIATLEEVFHAFPRQAVVNCHVKDDPAFPFSPGTIEKIRALVAKYDMREHIYFMSGSDAVMKAMLEVAPEIPRCMGAGAAPMAIVDNAAKWECAKVQFFKPHYNQAMIDRAHALGLRCNIFWSDDPEEARAMLAMGIDTVLTNDYWNIARVLA